jgi:hypothetical protein
MKALLIATLIALTGPFAEARERGAVVGVGSAGMPADRIYDRGVDVALFEIKTCGISGHFSNGARCYAVYNTGWSEWVGGHNNQLVAAFYVRVAVEHGRRP